MKVNRIIFFVIVVYTFFSCSTLRIEKKKYSKGFFISSNLAQNKNLQSSIIQKVSENKHAASEERGIKQEEIFPEKIIRKEQKNFLDTVRVYLKNGKVYQGVITEEKENGIFLQISPQRTIYLSRYEIDEVVVVQQDQEINNSSSNNPSASDDYYMPGNKSKKQPSHQKSSRLKRRLDDSVPKQIKTAETFFLLSGISTITFSFFFPVFFILGLIFLRKGYQIALADPDRYDMDRINRLRDLVRKVLMIFLVLFLIGLLAIGIWILIYVI